MFYGINWLESMIRNSYPLWSKDENVGYTKRKTDIKCYGQVTTSN